MAVRCVDTKRLFQSVRFLSSFQLFYASYNKADFLLPSISGKPFNAHLLIHNAVSNIICCLVFGDRFEYTDEKYHRILKAFNDVIQLQESMSVQVSPWHEHITSPTVPILFGNKTYTIDTKFTCLW